MTRLGWFLGAALAADVVLLTTVLPPRPVLLWNASPSVPIGLYAVGSSRRLRVGDLVVIAPPESLARFLASRRYLGLGVPLLKHLRALPGQRVCRSGRIIRVDGSFAGLALDRDRRGRPLPVWSGCRVIARGEMFLMNPAADSLDGRYFGALPKSAIVGQARALWIPAGR